MEQTILTFVFALIQIVLGYIIKNLSDRVDNLERKVDEVEKSYYRSFDELKTLILGIKTDLVREISQLRTELTEVKLKRKTK